MVKQKMTARICILESLDQKQQTVSHYLTPRRLLLSFHCEFEFLTKNYIL